jgi:hypothetical protein
VKVIEALPDPALNLLIKTDEDMRFFHLIPVDVDYDYFDVCTLQTFTAICGDFERLLTFTLYWRSGKREIIKGYDIADAMRRAGYGNSALIALDFHAKGDNTEYQWNREERRWEKIALLSKA